MNEPQVWTLLGVFAAALFGMLTLTTTVFLRVIRAEIGSVRTELRSGFGGLRGEFRGELAELRGELRGELGELRGELTTLHHRVDSLDRDLQALVKRSFGVERE